LALNRAAYNSLLYLLLPVFMLRLVWRTLLSRDYGRRWWQRFGYVRKARAQRSETEWIWVHAVSVGETLAAAPLLRALRDQHPHIGIVVTTMTPTGADRVHELFGDDVCHVWAPYDYAGAVKRFLGSFSPRVVVLMETELWPNLVHFSKKCGATVLVLNARLSERSFRGYQKFARLGKPMLQQIDLIVTQAAADAARFRALNVPHDRISVVGSMKVEAALPDDQGNGESALAHRIEGVRRIWIAASTRDGEEEKVLAAFGQILTEVPDALLVLVPRHPERFDAVEKLCRREGLRVVRRSEDADVDVLTHVFLGDSMGEMSDYYRLAEIAFVGGSLVDTGCQNVLEPAALGLPVLTGPSQFNFQTICEQLQEAGALEVVAHEGMLASRVVALMRDAEKCQRMGQAGRAAVTGSRGALQRTLQIVNRYL